VASGGSLGLNRPFVTAAAACAVLAASAAFGREPARRDPPSPGFDVASLGMPALRVYADRDGLPQNSVMDLAIDLRGYIWVATQDGLARYNGRSWTIVNLPNRTVSNFVRCLVAASDGSLWCGRQDGGVARLLPDGQWQSWDVERGLAAPRVYDLLEDGQGRIWASTANGVAMFDGSRWTTFAEEAGLPSRESSCLLAARDGSVLAGTKNGVARFRDGEWQVEGLPPRLLNSAIAALLETGPPDQTTLWLATDAATVASRSPDGAWRLWDPGHVAAATALAECRDRSGRSTIWLGTDGYGVRQLVDGQWQSFGVEQGLPNNSVWCFHPSSDQRGTAAMWVGTDAGLLRMTFGRWRTFDTRAGLPANSTYAMLITEQAGAQQLWVGTRGGGLVRLGRGGRTLFDRRSGLPATSVFSLAESRDAGGARTIWAGTNGGGLVRFENGRWHTIPELLALRPSLATDTVRKIEVLPSPAGDTMLLPTSKNGVLRYGAGRWEIIDTQRGLPGNDVFSAIETSGQGGNRTLWVGLVGAGLSRMDASGVTTYTTASGLSNNSVLSLHEARFGGRRWLWAGTEGGGVCRLDLDDPDGRWEVFDDSSSPAIPNNTVYQIQSDAQGRLYLFTNGGVARLTESSSSAFDAFTFTTEDGLPSNEFNGGASARDAWGRIWAGTPHGLTMFDPALEVEDHSAKPLLLERQLLTGSNRSLLPGEDLDHDENSVVFEFALLSYQRERDTRYRTELVGLDTGPSSWGTSATREFSSLRPGDYVFRVWARDFAGNESGPIELAFRISPPPWLTWWAIAGYVAASAALLFAASQYRMRALRQRAAALEMKVAERTHQLAATVKELQVSEQAARAAREEAVEANRAKSVFLSNMSHELRTPLNAVIGFAQLMARGAARNADDREAVEIIQRSGEHLLGLINDVLSLSKIEAGKLTLDQCSFDLPAMLRSVEGMTRVRAEAKGLAVVLEIDPSTPRRVRGDEGKLRQVLINLMSNAVKFTERGSVRLRAWWANDVAGFAVTDTGCGIAPAELEHLFEAFVQTESGRRSHEGTGLGLAISRSFVQLMGGELRVRSMPGEGTTFEFGVKLPLAEDSDIGVERRRVVGLADGERPRRLLIVDDGQDNRRLLTRMLGDVGFQTREAENGEEAIALWRDWQPELIWMDLRMPVLDGEAAVQRIRAEEAQSGGHVVIIALTASAFEHERERVIAAGCDDFLTKPLREEVIFDALARHLGVVFRFADLEARQRFAGELDSTALGAIPRQNLEALHRSLLVGSPGSAYDAIAAIASYDESLAAEITDMVKCYRYDELLDTIEKVLA
jgi:signal transduction histidine kinase/ligand-binding sensor domain-containing protein/DNA-binding NarL/FixJ family response regulator